MNQLNLSIPINVRDVGFEYQVLEGEEKQKVVDFVQEYLATLGAKPSQKQWESYWNETLQRGDTKPSFFKKKQPLDQPVYRFNNSYIKTNEENLGYKVLCYLIDRICKGYLCNVDYVVEFGAGTGHNLERIKNQLPNVKVFGSDFSPSAIKILENKGINAFLFDMLQCKDSLPQEVKDNLNKTAFLTSGSLEQLGENWVNFLNFVKEQKPKYLINIEPLYEFYGNLQLELLAKEFHEKKNYLRGYYPQLKSENFKMDVYFNRFGTLFDDGFNVVVSKLHEYK